MRTGSHFAINISLLVKLFSIFPFVVGVSHAPISEVVDGGLPVNLNANGSHSHCDVHRQLRIMYIMSNDD